MGGRGGAGLYRWSNTTPAPARGEAPYQVKGSIQVPTAKTPLRQRTSASYFGLAEETDARVTRNKRL